MPIQFNTGDKITQLNTSRIEKLMTAETKEAALYMGPWDTFKDYFRTGDNKKAAQIEKIYDSITKAPTNDQSPIGMFERFRQLRDMATHEDKANFIVNTDHEYSTGDWKYWFQIDDKKIFDSGYMPDDANSPRGQFMEFNNFFVESFSLSPLGRGTYEPSGRYINTCVVPKVDDPRDLKSAVQNVLHELTRDDHATSDDTEFSILKALKKVDEFVNPPTGLTNKDEITEKLEKKGLSEISDDPIATEMALSRVNNPTVTNKNPVQNCMTEIFENLEISKILMIQDAFRKSPVFGGEFSGALAASAMSIDEKYDDDAKCKNMFARTGYIQGISYIPVDIFNKCEERLGETIYADIKPEMWSLNKIGNEGGGRQLFDPPNGESFISNNLNKFIENITDNEMSYDDALNGAYRAN